MYSNCFNLLFDIFSSRMSVKLIHYLQYPISTLHGGQYSMGGGLPANAHPRRISDPVYGSYTALHFDDAACTILSAISLRLSDITSILPNMSTSGSFSSMVQYADLNLESH